MTPINFCFPFLIVCAKLDLPKGVTRVKILNLCFNFSCFDIDLPIKLILPTAARAASFKGPGSSRLIKRDGL